MPRKKSKRKPPKPSRKEYHLPLPTAREQEVEGHETEILSAFQKVMDTPDALPDTRLWGDVCALWALEHTIASELASGRASGPQRNWAKVQFILMQLEPLLDIVEDRLDISPGQLAEGNYYAWRRVWRKIAAAERKAKAEGAKQPWDADLSEYVSNSVAITSLTRSGITLSGLSKMLTPGGKVRYMKKGQRCKVHLGDLVKYFQDEDAKDGIGGAFDKGYDKGRRDNLAAETFEADRNNGKKT